MAKLAYAALTAFAICLSARGDGPCVATGQNARVTWSGSAPTARLYFHSDNAKAEHYVEMRRVSAGRFVAVLPKVLENVASIVYRVATADAGGRYTTRNNATMAIGACAPAKLSGDESRMAGALVVGATAEGPAVPVGFGCEGIVGRITEKGELSSYDACAAPAPADLSIGASTKSVSVGNRGATPKPLTAPPETSLGVGTIAPDHHRRPRRAPVPVTPPNPRLVEPVSDSRP